MVFISFFSIKTFAQKHTEGYLKFEITEFKADNADDPQMEMVESMIKGTKTKLYFNKEKALTKINSMMTNMKILVDTEGNSEMYMEMMGQKFLIKMNKADADKLAEEHADKKPKFTHHKDQTKEILGFKTYLVEGMVDGQANATMKFWITDEIETKGMVSQGMDNEELGGFPLEYTVGIAGQFTLTTKATKFEKDFDSSVFDFDKSEFVEKSMDDLQGMGMGGGF